MSKEKLTRVAGLDITMQHSAVIGSVALWVLVGGGAARLFNISAGYAIVGGLVAVALHWASDIVHNLGHAWAARRTGYPMTGVRLWWLLGTSLYPDDEPPLPASVHIRRALGGPAASLLLTLLGAVIAVLLRPLDKTPGWIAAFFCLENLLVFTLGALVPMGFTDGSTLLKWWRKRKSEPGS